mmetsp:Transcript_63230/g.150808  ORF Transcript_63230/g.150808 Transcript_63230/m.150808 type:complete len:93 (-) Transcript_63230:157-435(-)
MTGKPASGGMAPPLGNAPMEGPKAGSGQGIPSSEGSSGRSGLGTEKAALDTANMLGAALLADGGNGAALLNAADSGPAGALALDDVVFSTPR